MCRSKEWYYLPGMRTFLREGDEPWFSKARSSGSSVWNLARASKSTGVLNIDSILDIVSAVTLLEPIMYQMSVVNWAMKDNCLNCGGGSFSFRC